MRMDKISEPQFGHFSTLLVDSAVFMGFWSLSLAFRSQSFRRQSRWHLQCKCLVCDCLGGYYERLLLDPQEFVCDTLLSPVCRWSRNTSSPSLRPPGEVDIFEYVVDYLVCLVNIKPFNNGESVNQISGPKFRLNPLWCDGFQGLLYTFSEKSRCGWAHRCSFSLFLHVTVKLEARVWVHFQ